VLFAYLFAAAFRATALFAELLLTALLVETARFVELCVLERGRVVVRWADALTPDEDTLFFALELCVREREELDVAVLVFGAAPLWVITALDVANIGTAASRASAQTRQPQVKRARARMEA
jgi:hypothetical protein